MWTMSAKEQAVREGLELVQCPHNPSGFTCVEALRGYFYARLQPTCSKTQTCYTLESDRSLDHNGDVAVFFRKVNISRHLCTNATPCMLRLYS